MAGAKEQSEELTKEEAAQLRGVSTTTLYALIARGLVHKHKKPTGVGRGGRRVYFLRSELEALKEGKPVATPKPRLTR